MARFHVPSDDEDENDDMPTFQGYNPAPPQPQPAYNNPYQHPALNNFMGGGFGGAAGFGGMMQAAMGGHIGAPAPPSAFNRSYRAYSSAIHEIQQGRGNAGASVMDGGRTQVMFGGQIMMPPSALRHLTELDVEGPWTFELINQANPSLKTHAGVLEFTADEGVIYLPSWMMKRLQLEEGDAIRTFGTRLPKGKLVKLQAQSVTFLELSDPKAVLEQALRAYTALTENDIIEISYNMMTFELLVMEIEPKGAGINILNTDLEVDFATPLGYVEPERKPREPAPTMKSKLKINTDQTQDVDAKGKGSGTSTPAVQGGTAAGGSGTSTPAPGQGGAGAKAGGAAGTGKGQDGPWEAFKGIGNTMGGKRVRGKGISVKKVEPVDKDSKIFRTSEIPRIVTSDTQIGTRKVPAALNLPEGTLFFGFKVVPPPKKDEGAESGDKDAQHSNAGGVKPPAFEGAGQGVTLSGRLPKSATSSSKGKGKGKQNADVIQIDSD